LNVWKASMYVVSEPYHEVSVIVKYVYEACV